MTISAPAAVARSYTASESAVTRNARPEPAGAACGSRSSRRRSPSMTPPPSGHSSSAWATVAPSVWENDSMKPNAVTIQSIWVRASVHCRQCQTVGGGGVPGVCGLMPSSLVGGRNRRLGYFGRAPDGRSGCRGTVLLGDPPGRGGARESLVGPVEVGVVGIASGVGDLRQVRPVSTVERGDEVGVGRLETHEIRELFGAYPQFRSDQGRQVAAAQPHAE